MRLARAKDIAFRHAVIPLYAPVHRAGIERSRRQTFASIEEMAQAIRPRRRGPVILLGRHQHMGDVLMASAVIRHLRQLHPDAAVFFATQRRYHALVAHNPHLDHVVDCECMGSLLALAKHPAFDRQHLLVPSDTYCELCGVSYGDPLQGHQAAGRQAPWFHHGRHLVELMFERVGASGADPTPEIHVPADVRVTIRNRLSRLVPAGASLVAMHTRTPHWPAKQWPVDNFIALMRRVTTELGMQVVVLGSEKAPDLPPGVIDLTRRTSMLETAAVLAEADVFVGLDSGPSHLASAVGTPSVILFGPTDPVTCRPLGPNVTVLWHGCEEDGLFSKTLRAGTQANRDIIKITVDEVMSALNSKIAVQARAKREPDTAPCAGRGTDG